jgi:hypothetical protein
MTHYRPFETLDESDFVLADQEQETAMADWLVAYATHPDDGLFYQTNAEALVLEMIATFHPETMRLAHGFHGEKIALITPHATGMALARTMAYAAEMAAGQHINLGHYHKAQAAKCGERWDEMELSSRFQMIKDHGGSVRLAMLDAPPGLVMATLMQTFE